MSARARLLTKDEELGKRDDDFRPQRSSSSTTSPWLPWHWRRRRLFILVAVVLLLYYFVPTLPTDLTSIRSQLPATNHYDPANAVPTEPSGAPPRDRNAESDEASKHYYNGMVRFFKLAASLHQIARTNGNMPQNRNILFAASSLKSLANLMPMACEMASIDRNYVHVTIFGRSSLLLEDILALNGVNEQTCKAYFHDARGDFAEYSTDLRAEVATKGAMKHINDYMHPQAIIMDDHTKEDASFARALQSKAKEYNVALIEVPAGKYEEWLWITRLDAGSLHEWFSPDIEILIHAPPDSSGGLIRLLKSLSNADYKGLKVPKLTIELPPEIPEALQNFIYWFQWPPRKEPDAPSLFTLRHRIPASRATSEQASVRFVESFFPTQWRNTHVLLLSPQAEISPLYLQYLHYNLLEYKYASWGSPGSEDLMGLSLGIPTSPLSGKGRFEQPNIGKMSFLPAKFADDAVAANTAAASPFVYQGMSSVATLVFGDRWETFHDFLSKRLQASHSGKNGKTDKVVSESEPAWVEFLVELMRARGWTVLHPPASLVTIHNELAQFPEEFARPPASDHKATEAFKSSDHPEEEPFVLSADPVALAEHFEADTTRSQMPLHKLLPFNGELQEISGIPHVSHEGETVPEFSFGAHKSDYTAWFRAAIGGCQGADASRDRVQSHLKTDDLFCLPGIDMRFIDKESEFEDDWSAGVAQAIVEGTSEDSFMDNSDQAHIASVDEVIKPPARVETL